MVTEAVNLKKFKNTIKGHSVTYDKNIMFFYIYFETTCDFHFKETYMIQLMIKLHLDLCWIDEMYMNPILFV